MHAGGQVCFQKICCSTILSTPFPPPSDTWEPCKRGEAEPVQASGFQSWDERRRKKIYYMPDGLISTIFWKRKMKFSCVYGCSVPGYHLLLFRFLGSRLEAVALGQEHNVEELRDYSADVTLWWECVTSKNCFINNKFARRVGQEVIFPPKCWEIVLFALVNVSQR